MRNKNQPKNVSVLFFKLNEKTQNSECSHRYLGKNRAMHRVNRVGMKKDADE